MYFWNKDNFEGLKQIGEHYASHPNLSFYGEYCLSKEKGLKKAANQATQHLLSHLNQLPLATQRQLGLELSYLYIKHSGVSHQMMPYPLSMYLQNLLAEWAKSEPENVDILFAAGYLCGNYAFFEKVLTIDPNHQMSLTRLLNAEIDQVDFQTHHLDEGAFIGKVDDAIDCLQQAKNRIDKLKDEHYKSSYLAEYRYYKELLDAWIAFSQETTNDNFVDWCKKHGHHFSFPTKIYYSK